MKALVRNGDIELKTALRIEDHFGGESVDERRLRQVAADVAGMSNAQQADYFGAAEVSGQQVADHRPGRSNRSSSP